MVCKCLSAAAALPIWNEPAGTQTCAMPCASWRACPATGAESVGEEAGVGEAAAVGAMAGCARRPAAPK